MRNIVNGIMGNTLRRYLVVALMAYLAVTSGMFAYAYTTGTQAISVTAATADFAEIGPASGSAATPPPTYKGSKLFGSYRGAMWGGTLFSVNVTDDYTGDIAINVYLDNIDEMGKNYGMWMMKLRFVDSADNATAVDIQGIDRPLTLNNGVVTFIAKDLVSANEYYIDAVSGVYRSHSWGYITNFGTIQPSITAEILQAQ